MTLRLLFRLKDGILIVWDLGHRYLFQIPSMAELLEIFRHEPKAER